MVEGHFQMSHKFNVRNSICGQLSLRLLNCHDREGHYDSVTVTVTHSDQWRTEGGLGVKIRLPLRNSEVLAKSNRIAN